MGRMKITDVRCSVAANRAEQFTATANRCLGQAVDADGNLYCAETGLGAVVKITPDGAVSTYATGPEGRPLLCANYPAFDCRGALYVSDSGDWSGAVNGRLYRIEPGGGAARLWYPDAIDTPNAIALDADERYLYLVETFGAGIARVAIEDDGSAGRFERVLHMPRHVPDGIAFDGSSIRGFARALEIGLRAGHQVQVAAFLREEFGAGEPDAFRGAGDEHGFPGQLQVHRRGSFP
jgi:sugar lactone lactonase YvrE